MQPYRYKTGVLNVYVGSTPLHCAAMNGHDVVARLLIENGAEVSAATFVGVTPLRHAVQNGHEAVFELLISNGANVSAAATSPWHDANLYAGSTPLHCAALHGHYVMARLLIENGAEVSAADIIIATIRRFIILSLRAALPFLVFLSGSLLPNYGSRGPPRAIKPYPVLLYQLGDLVAGSFRWLTPACLMPVWLIPVLVLTRAIIGGWL